MKSSSHSLVGCVGPSKTEVAMEAFPFDQKPKQPAAGKEDDRAPIVDNLSGKLFRARLLPEWRKLGCGELALESSETTGESRILLRETKCESTLT